MTEAGEGRGPANLRTIRVSLLAGWTPPPEGASRINEMHGGPEALLAWLEQALGLRGPGSPRPQRVIEMHARLEKAKGVSYARSMEADRWATSSELLERRDRLLLAGWDPRAGGEWPPLVADLAAAESSDLPLSPGEPERLAAVLAALAAGQNLPPHRVVLSEEHDLWPPLWRRVLSKLKIEAAPSPAPAAPEGSQLRAAQECLLERASRPLRPDRTLAMLRAGSVHAACQALAAMLGRFDGDLRRVAIVCEDESAAHLLDEALRARGLPTMGASRRSTVHPALQLLPLALRLCWEPVDPYALLDLLMLPGGPFPPQTAERLADALRERPGLGSREWKRAVQRLTDPRTDTGGATRDLLETWIDIERRERSQPMPVMRVQGRCGVVEAWAGRRLREVEAAQGDPSLVAALRSAIYAARALSEVATSYGEALSGPQLDRVLDSIIQASAVSERQRSLAGGPTWAATLADVPEETELAVWLGTGTRQEPSSKWTRLELQAMGARGLDADDGARDLKARRLAERRGIANASRLLVVQLPPREEERTHPIWLEVERNLPDGEPPRIEDVAERHLAPPEGHVLPTAEIAVAPLPDPGPAWDLSPAAAAQAGRTSASSLGDRLGCGIKWALDKVAHVEPGPAADLPQGGKLKGEFGHAVLEEVFGRPGAPPDPEAAARAAGETFDHLLPLDAAPLALPHKLAERIRLRENIVESARLFARLLRDGGYRVVGMEKWVETELDGRTIAGKIDSLIERGVDGSRELAVVDFKNSWARGFRKKLEEGRPLQLAFYAGLVGAAGEGPVRGAAFLVLESSKLLTPSGSPVAGAAAGEVVSGPSVLALWEKLVAAAKEADALLASTGKVFAHPLQNRPERPAYASIVLDDELDEGEDQECCKFCVFGFLCGYEEVRE